MADVLLVAAAVEDLERYREHGNFPRILKKLLLIERDPRQVGEPLSRGLKNYRRVVVGNRDWRIIFKPEPDGSAATVWVIGDRADDSCYRTARQRVAAAALEERPGARRLMEVLDRLEETRRHRLAGASPE